MVSENYTEKVSVNINSSTLSTIDLLVDNGYYSNRSDFINQALRESLLRQQTTVDRIVERNVKKTTGGDQWFLGVFGLTAREVEELFAEGENFHLRGYGVLHIASGCDEEKLKAVLKSISIKGKVFAPDSVKRHYGLK